jgi:hypothetical protein
MCRPWGIRLKRERNEVRITPKGMSPWVTFSVVECDAFRKMVLLRWNVGAGGITGGAVGSARSGVSRLGEGRVPSRDCVSRGEVPVAGERGVGVGKRMVGTSKGWSSEAYTRKEITKPCRLTTTPNAINHH